MQSGALIPLFSREDAPGIRDGIRERAQWRLTEVQDGWGSVEPAEGAGTVYPYFKLHRLCDASSTITAETWEPLRLSPGYEKAGVPARTNPRGQPRTDWDTELGAWADKWAAEGRRGSEFMPMQARLTSLPVAEVPDYLSKNVPGLLAAFPAGTLWFCETDRLLPARMSVLRILANQELIPDLFEHAVKEGELPGLEMLQEHSLTSGASFKSLADSALLVLPPTTLGVAFDWMPHALVLTFGFAAFVPEGHPPTFASMFAPRTSSAYGFHWRDNKIWDGVDASTGDAFLQWWVTRLNVIYSHVCDPTRFLNPTSARYDAPRQTAWLLTFERLLADALAIRSHPQASPLLLNQSAFDLLDKAEALLGYETDKTGKGFQRLLRRSEMVPLLTTKWQARLPLQLRQRFVTYTQHLYDRLYEDTLEEAYAFRRTAGGVAVWNEEQGKLIDRHADDYVPKLIRAVRNSSHGLLDQLATPRHRSFLATHTGTIPSVLPDLAALLALALVADAENLCAGTWFPP